MLPLYTAFLTTEDYGIKSIADSFVVVMGFIVAFSLFSAIRRFYVDYKDDIQILKRFYGTIVVFTYLSSISFCVMMFFARELLKKYVFSGVDFFPIVFLSFVMLVFYCQVSIFDNVLKSQQKAMLSSIINIVYFFVNVGLNVLFVVFLKMGATGILTAMSIGYICYTVYFVIYMKIHNQITLCLDRKLLIEALKYSIPIMPHNLSTQIAVLISKVIIGGTGSLGSVGIYAIATQFGNVADTIQGYVDNAYGPWLYEKLHAKEEGFKASIRDAVRLLIAAVGLFFLGISLFAQDYILLFIDSSYVEAWKYIPLIVMVYAIKTAYYFYVEILFYYKEASKFLFTATLSSSILNIVFSAFFIPICGIFGSILADALAMVLRVGIVYAISRRYEDIGLVLGDFIINFILVGFFTAAGMSLSLMIYGNQFSIINFLFKVFVVLTYIFAMFLINRQMALPLVKKYIIKLKARRREK